MRTITAAAVLESYGHRWAIVSEERDAVYSLYASQDLAERVCQKLNASRGRDVYHVAKIVA